MSDTLLKAWNRTVRAAPDAPALIDASVARVWKRRELDALAEAWSLAHRDAVAGQSVVFAEPNGVEWLRVFLGLLKSDAVVVALDPGEPQAVRRALADRVGASLLWNGGPLERLTARTRLPRDGRRLLKLTSGSTGTPRALAFTDAQLLADGRQVCSAMGIAPGDLNFALIPFGHSYGLGNLVIPLLAQGTAVVAGTMALPQVMAAEIKRWKPSVFPAVPALLRALVESAVAPAQLRSLRTIVSAGAPLAPEIARAFHAKFGKKIHNFYGSSETGGITYDRTGNAALTGRSVGRPLRGVRLVFGRGGRFTVASAAVFTLGNRQRRATRGGYRPADFAELNAQGELVLLGRAGRLVKIGGRRLNLAEVENVLMQLPGVRDAWVQLHAGRTDALAAVVATDRTAGELRGALRERLAAWKIPRKLVVVAEFPVTARGKIDTRRLREMLERESAPPGDSA